MFIYILILVFLGILSLSRNKKLLFLSFPLLLFVSAFRSVNVGTDTYNYYLVFNMLVKADVYNLEFLWRILSDFVKYIGGTFQMLVFFASILVLLPIFYVIGKTSRSPNFSILIFYLLWYYFYSFNIMRQSIACAFIFLAAFFLMKRKYWLTAITVIVSTMFHTISFVAIPVFVFLFFKDAFRSNNTYYLILFLSLVIGLVVGPQILAYITTFSESFNSYNHYAESLSVSVVDIITFLILYDVMFIIILILIQKKDIWFQMYFFSIIIMNISILFPYGERISTLLGTAQIILFSNIVYNNKLHGNKELVGGIVLVYCLLSFALKFNSNVSEVIPYELTFMGFFN